MSHLIRIASVSSLLICLCLSACRNPAGSNIDGSTQTNGSLAVCDGTIPRESLANILNGDLFVVASYNEDGARLTSRAGGLLSTLAEGGLNIDTMNTFGFGFRNGIYSLTTPSHSIQLVFFFAQNSGSFQAGDTIPDNLFDESSYVKNVKTSSSGVSYDKGPLWGLVQGGISWSNLQPRISLNTTLISFTVQSTANYYSPALGSADFLHLFMTTVPATLQTFMNQVDAGGFAFSYDSTYYAGSLVNVSETICASTFYMRRADSTWYWTGNYRGSVIKGDYHFYMHGFASNIEPNYAGFYCDPAFADSFGVALDDTSLTSGHFYSVGGDTLTYLLTP